MINGNALTLIPQLPEGKTTQLSIAKGALVGTNGASFDGLAGYEVTTADLSEPVLVSTVPPMNGEAETSGTIQFIFNKPVFVTGNWTATITSGNETSEIPADFMRAEGAKLFFPFEASSYMFFTVEIAEGSIADQNGNEYSEDIVLFFHTKGGCWVGV